MTVDELREAGHRAVLEADQLWRAGIFDPRASDTSIAARVSRVAIDQMIRGVEGLGWSWLDAYKGDGSFEWCGAFVARCWFAAGLPLKPSRYNFFASTSRLDQWARYRPWEKQKNKRPSVGPWRQVIDLDAHSSREVRFEDGSLPQAGDILILGDAASLKHITLLDYYDAATGTFHTYEGNGRGMSPNGEIWQGVVKGERQLGLRAGQKVTTYHARRLMRLAPHDLAG